VKVKSDDGSSRESVAAHPGYPDVRIALLAARPMPRGAGHRPGVRRTETFIKIDDSIGAEGGHMERKVQAVERLV
jgi:hypothetical protein